MKLTKNYFLRILIIILLLMPLIFFQEFYIHFYTYLSSNVITSVVTQQWMVVLFFIILFIAFLIPLSYRRKAGWVEYGLVTAFFVSLFVEMYGIPLTILLASKYFFVPGTQLPPNVLSISFMGVGLGLDLAMIYGSLLILIGMSLIILGWFTLYQNIKREGLVTSGILPIQSPPPVFRIYFHYFGLVIWMANPTYLDICPYPDI